MYMIAFNFWLEKKQAIFVHITGHWLSLRVLSDLQKQHAVTSGSTAVPPEGWGLKTIHTSVVVQRKESADMAVAGLVEYSLELTLTMIHGDLLEELVRECKRYAESQWPV